MSSRLRGGIGTATLLVLNALCGARAEAQLNEVGGGAGLAVPVYEAAAVRDPGFHLFAFLGMRLGDRLQMRGEIAFTQLAEDPRDPSQGRPPGELRVLGVDASLVWSPAGTGHGIYGIAGAGLYALRTTAEPANPPPPPVPGITLGAGVNFRIAEQPLFAQARVEVPFSTYGTYTESAPNMYLPITLGMRIPCCAR